LCIRCHSIWVLLLFVCAVCIGALSDCIARFHPLLSWLDLALSCASLASHLGYLLGPSVLLRASWGCLAVHRRIVRVLGHCWFTSVETWRKPPSAPLVLYFFPFGLIVFISALLCLTPVLLRLIVVGRVGLWCGSRRLERAIARAWLLCSPSSLFCVCYTAVLVSLSVCHSLLGPAAMRSAVSIGCTVRWYARLTSVLPLLVGCVHLLLFCRLMCLPLLFRARCSCSVFLRRLVVCLLFARLRIC